MENKNNGRTTKKILMSAKKLEAEKLAEEALSEISSYPYSFITLLNKIRLAVCIAMFAALVYFGSGFFLTLLVPLSIVIITDLVCAIKHNVSNSIDIQDSSPNVFIICCCFAIMALFAVIPFYFPFVDDCLHSPGGLTPTKTLMFIGGVWTWPFPILVAGWFLGILLCCGLKYTKYMIMVMFYSKLMRYMALAFLLIPFLFAGIVALLMMEETWYVLIFLFFFSGWIGFLQRLHR